MNTAIGIIGLLAAIVFLIVFTFKQHSVIIIAPLAAMVAIFFSYGIKGHYMASYTITYMTGFANYVKSYFPLYLLGAVFAKLMESSGYAGAIADFVSSRFGQQRAILSVVVTCAVLTYGGVSLFVVAFAVLPIAIQLFRRADIPKRLIPGAIALGSFSFTMAALPGSPQVENTIPMTYFGTDTWAAPVLGLIAAVFMFLCGMVWLTWRQKKLQAAGEHYGNYDDVAATMKIQGKTPEAAAAIIPILIILTVNLVLSKLIYPNVDGTYLETEYGTSLESQSGNWSVLIGMLAAIIFIIVARFKVLYAGLRDDLKTAAGNCLKPLMNSCAVVGFGSVIKTLTVFGVIQTFLMSISDNPLLNEVLYIDVLCGITGSASGGLGAALESLADTYLASGISPQVLHRVAAVASGGLDNLPYNGAVITVLALCGMTHKDSYLDVFVVSDIIPLLASFLLVILATLGLQC